MSKKSQHVVKGSKGGWDVKKGGGEKASRHFDTQQEAMEGRSQRIKRLNFMFMEKMERFELKTVMVTTPTLQRIKSSHGRF